MTANEDEWPSSGDATSKWARLVTSSKPTTGIVVRDLPRDRTSMSQAALDKFPTRPERTPREREIIDAAAEVFHEKGYAGASIQDVADAVGILKGSLYY